MRDDPHGAAAAALEGDDAAFASAVEPQQFAAFGLPLVLRDADD